MPLESISMDPVEDMGIFPVKYYIYCMFSVEAAFTFITSITFCATQITKSYGHW